MNKTLEEYIDKKFPTTEKKLEFVNYYMDVLRNIAFDMGVEDSYKNEDRRNSWNIEVLREEYMKGRESCKH